MGKGQILKQNRQSNKFLPPKAPNQMQAQKMGGMNPM